MSFRMSEIPKPAGDLELDFLRVVRQGRAPRHTAKATVVHALPNEPVKEHARAEHENRPHHGAVRELQKHA